MQALTLRRITSLLCFGGLCVILVMGVHKTIRSPRWNWDVIGYLGCAYEFTTTDVSEIHKKTYAAIDAELPATRSAELRSEIDYRVAVSTDPVSFAQQLPFYRIRPLYNGAVAAAMGLGVPPARATVVVSTVSALLIVLVLLLWLLQRFPASVAAVISGAVVLAVPLMHHARSSSPDTLAALLVVAGLALATEASRRRSAVGLAVLVLSIAARTDLVTLVVPLCAVLALTARQRRRQIDCAVAGLLAVSTLFCVQVYAGWYGWSTVFLHTFEGAISYPGDVSRTVSPGAYWNQLVDGLHSWNRERALIFAATGIGLAWFSRHRSPSTAVVATVVVVSMVLHYLPFPVWWRRFFVAHYTILATLCLAQLALSCGLGRLPGAPAPEARAGARQ